MSSEEKPFLPLGNHLKTVRNRAKRSLAEVSGAVEIDEDQLKLIEAGQKRPDEDVMLLLISYFNMADKEALRLWELARYDTALNDHIEIKELDPQDSQLMTKPVVMLLTAMDVRTMYSDGIEVSWNEAGVTLSFTQSNNVPIAKVGMSHKQAETVIKVIERALLNAKYNGAKKLLPPGNQL